MSKHTPGPWGQMSGMPTNVLGAGGIRVARCDFDGDFEHQQAHANARLIAMSPEMFEVLQAIASGGMSMYGSPTDMLEKFQDMACTVVAKVIREKE
jgi:hypothetical protein